MTAVSNAGPLMALGKIGALASFACFDLPINLPTAVYEEVVVDGLALGMSDAVAVQLELSAGTLRVISVTDSDIPGYISELPLDRGEKQAIHIALRESADLVLLDDLRARDEAKALGLQVKGTLGILIQAHRSGILAREETIAFIGAIKARSDIWISDSICDRAASTL